MILNAKEYYRKLDVFLSDIYKIDPDNVLSTVLKELVDHLGKELHIKNGRLYELVVDQYELVNVANINDSNKNNKILLIENEAVQLVLQHGSYIYNEPNIRLPIKAENRKTTRSYDREVSKSFFYKN